jgi:regulator of replication initiation timing
MPTIDLVSDLDAAALAQEVRELAERLDRERARNAGLERGISALSERVDALRLENLELLRRLEHRA